MMPWCCCEVHWHWSCRRVRHKKAGSHWRLRMPCPSRMARKLPRRGRSSQSVPLRASRMRNLCRSDSRCQAVACTSVSCAAAAPVSYISILLWCPCARDLPVTIFHGDTWHQRFVNTPEQTSPCNLAIETGLCRPQCNKLAQLLKATTTDLRCAHNGDRVRIIPKQFSPYYKRMLSQATSKKQMMQWVTATQT
jgi:hypothetical protein